MSIILSIIGFVWSAIVWLYIAITVFEAVALLSIFALGKKMRYLLAEHPLADERMERLLKNPSPAPLNIRIVVSIILLSTLFL